MLQRCFRMSVFIGEFVNQKAVCRTWGSNPLHPRLTSSACSLPLLVRLTRPLFDDLQFLPQLDHAAVRKNPAKVYAGINHAIATDDRAGIDHCVATDFRSIANDCAEFSETCWNVAVGCYDGDFAVIKFYVGENHARAQMRVMTNDRVTYVIEVGHLYFIEQNGIFEFAGVSHDNAIPDDDIFPNIDSAANMAVFSDPRRAF